MSNPRGRQTQQASAVLMDAGSQHINLDNAFAQYKMDPRPPPRRPYAGSSPSHAFASLSISPPSRSPTSPTQLSPGNSKLTAPGSSTHLLYSSAPPSPSLTSSTSLPTTSDTEDQLDTPPESASAESPSQSPLSSSVDANAFFASMERDHTSFSESSGSLERDWTTSDESTPRAEISQPVWPLSSISSPGAAVSRHPSSPRRVAKSRLSDEAVGSLSQIRQGNADAGSVNREEQEERIRRAASLRRKHASLDTAAMASTPAFATLSTARPDLGRGQYPSKEPAPLWIDTKQDLKRNSKSSRTPDSLSPTSNDFPPAAGTLAYRRHSELPNLGVPAGSQLLASSSTTGCYISAPISPPAHYPIPMSASSSSSSSARRPGRDRVDSPTPSSSSGSLTSASTASSSSSASSGRSQVSSLSRDLPTPTIPKWATPPTRTNRTRAHGRTNNFKGLSDESDRAHADFDAELFDGTASDEEVEVIKGMEGRIAVRSTKLVYEIMVWLPGFTLDNITIATRGAKTVHIVADQWEIADHAQWDIKLGDDANMRSISAKFGGQDLRITVAREQRYRPTLRRRHTPDRSLGTIMTPGLSTSTPSSPREELSEAELVTPAQSFWARQWSPNPVSRWAMPSKAQPHTTN